jgi:hypothetical protein
MGRQHPLLVCCVSYCGHERERMAAHLSARGVEGRRALCRKRKKNIYKYFTLNKYMFASWCAHLRCPTHHVVRP